jgi:hypothetical protein
VVLSSVAFLFLSIGDAQPCGEVFTTAEELSFAAMAATPPDAAFELADAASWPPWLWL